MKKRSLFTLLAIAALWSCQPDEPGVTGTDPVIIQDNLSGGASTKRWVVETATLKPSGSTHALNISSLANIRDDEFVFRATGQKAVTMQWKLRNDIKTDATSTKDALLDFYLSPLSKDLAIQTNGDILTSDANLKVVFVAEDKLKMSLSKGGTELSMELVPQTEEHSTMASSLQFNKMSEVTGRGLEQAAGFTGSLASNSLYLAYRSLDGDNAERVLKFDLTSKTFGEASNFVHSDFVTKEVHIINDELKVVGAQYVNTYSLDLVQVPTSVPHGLKITRYGSTVVDNNVYLFGGDINGLAGNKIYKHDQLTGLLAEVGTLPEPRYWAHGEMVDGRLYVFGGRQTFATEQAEDDIFVWDAATGTTDTYHLPATYHRTFAARQDHRILIATQRNIPPSAEGLSDWAIETTFGYFDTHDNTFHALPSSLAGTSQHTVYGLTIVGSHAYVLYGNVFEEKFEIYEANLEE